MFSMIVGNGHGTDEAFCHLKAGLILPLIGWKFKQIIRKMHVFEKNHRVLLVKSTIMSSGQ